MICCFALLFIRRNVCKFLITSQIESQFILSKIEKLLYPINKYFSSTFLLKRFKIGKKIFAPRVRNVYVIIW